MYSNCRYMWKGYHFLWTDSIVILCKGWLTSLSMVHMRAWDWTSEESRFPNKTLLSTCYPWTKSKQLVLSPRFALLCLTFRIQILVLNGKLCTSNSKTGQTWLNEVILFWKVYNIILFNIIQYHSSAIQCRELPSMLPSVGFNNYNVGMTKKDNNKKLLTCN